MATDQSDVEIVNMALDWLKEAPITSFDDATRRSDWFKRNYNQVRNATLVSLPWNFARCYWEQPQDPDVKTGPWTTGYRRPRDMLRMDPLRQGGRRENPRIPYELTNGHILTDLTDPTLTVSGWMLVTNAGLFTPLFVEVLALRLAYKSCHFITGKRSQMADLKAELRDATTLAQRQEAKENPRGTGQPDTSHITATRSFNKIGRTSSYR